jgi:hypothetical protein
VSAPPSLRAFHRLFLFLVALPMGFAASPSYAVQCFVQGPTIFDRGCYDRCVAPYALPGYGADDHHAALCRDRCSTVQEVPGRCPAAGPGPCQSVAQQCVDRCNQREARENLPSAEVRGEHFQRCMTGCELRLKRELRCK